MLHFGNDYKENIYIALQDRLYVSIVKDWTYWSINDSRGIHLIRSLFLDSYTIAPNPRLFFFNLIFISRETNYISNE
jgi:hypothetical protein